MPTGREHFALDWIKSELLETLSEARDALEAFAESDRDASLMRTCLTGMHQVHGTLVMLELEGMALLADHLERLAQQLLNQTVVDEFAAGQCLMQGILELPGYLDEIQQGFPDTTEPMLPLVNEVRRHLGDEALAGAGVTELPGMVDEAAVERFEGIDGIDKAKKIRSAYQQVLLSILKGGERGRAVKTLGKVAQGLCRVCEGTPHESQWRAFGEFVSSLGQSEGPLDGDAVKLLRRIDSEIRQLAQEGVTALKTPISLELVRQLIDSCRQRNYSSDTVVELRAMLEGSSQNDGLAISGRQALASAAGALREELALVKDQLDLFVRSGEQPGDELGALLAPLKQIGSTLSLLGFESSKTILSDQVDTLNAAVEAGSIDQQTLMVVASALVQVDENLASFTQGKAEVEKITDDAHRAVAVESRAGLEQVKQAIVDYISSQWDPRHLASIPAQISGICGALEMIPLPRAAQLLGGCGAYIAESLMSDGQPEWQDMDALADAISGVDYYLERLAEEASLGADDILELVQRSLDSLGYGHWQAADQLPDDLEAPTFVAAEMEAEAEAEAEVEAEAGIRVAEDDIDMQADAEPLHGDSAITEVGDTAESEEPRLQMDDDTSFDLSNSLFDELAGESAEGRAQATPTLEIQDLADDQVVDLPEAEISADAVPDIVPESGAEPAVADEVDLQLEPEADLEPGLVAAELDSEAEADEGADAEPSMIVDEQIEPGILDLDEVLAADASSAEEVSAIEDVTVAPPASPLADHIAAKTATLVDVFESDEEIVEIFVEEVGEVLEAIAEWLPRWQEDFINEDALSEVRRAFHTLKGSGRIVGANVIGEVAWSIENMLNRVIEGTVEPNPQFMLVVDEARNLTADLRAAFEVEQAPNMDQVGRLMERADILASGGALEDSAQAVAPPPIDVDARDELDQQPVEAAALFVSEAQAHLQVLHSALDEGEFAINEDTLRALHTLAGSSAMVGLDPISELARPSYELARALSGGVDEAAVGGEFAEFFDAALAALAQGVIALEQQRQPEDQLQLIADADRLLMRVAEEQPAVSDLMALPGLATVMEAEEFFGNWHTGAVDLEFTGKLVAALAEVARAAAETNRVPMLELAQAQMAAIEHLEHDALDASSYAALTQAHECLLRQFDALAADQAIAAADSEILVLQSLLTRDDVETQDEEVRAEPEVESKSDAEPALVEETEEIEQIAEADAQVAVSEAYSSADNVLSFPQEADDEPSKPLQQVAEVTAVTFDPQTLIAEDLDEEIIGIFFEEADEILEVLDQSIHEWSGETENRLYLENLLRGLHTLKGGARLSGLTQLGDLTHQFESFLIEVQGSDTPPEADFFSGLGARYDELASLLGQIRDALKSGDALPAVAEEQAPAGPAEPVAVEPEEVVAAEPVTAVPEPVEAGAEEAEIAAAESPATEQLPEFAAAPDAQETSADVPAKVDRGKEMVRVGAGLLEELVNLAGESSIVRARVEQGMNDFTSALDEMETTINRVREQLRRLEMETETQILFRRDSGDGPSYEEFDPLEMDRYSQLQQLSRGLSESASDMLDLKDTLLFKARESETLLLQQARINTELQEGLMRTRMVPFSRLLPRLRRIVRQVSRELGKEIEFQAYNVEGELDRNLLERMVPPLEHMLRNAVDHGIESAELRKSYGKPAAGRIDLRLSREGGDVVIEISDDGAGIDVESVRAKALERGLIAEGATLHDEEISQFVLAPGFSTAKSVTQISGRGVGMDVVHSEVKQLGGSINILSRSGKGSRFTVRVPFTVSVNRALMVSVGDDLYAIPLNNIEGIVLLSPSELETLYAPNGNTFEYAGIPYRVRYLGHYLGREFRASVQQASVPVVLVRSGDQAVAVHVDAVQGSREIVVKSLGPQFAGVGGVSGATILGDGSVVVILDLLALIRAQVGEGLTVSRRPLAGTSRTRCVMVVDDSVTVRKVTSRLLERQGMDVLVAKDGIEAVSLLQERRPDIMLLDIEMPRMDGFEVARQVRHDDRLRGLPIIMISSRTGEKHQERAVELGVRGFLGKPFQESELLAKIDELVNQE